MADARCSCGGLTLTLSGPSKLVVACHCLDCQRTTGAPFGVGAFYPVDAVAVSGTPNEFTRDAASGGKVRTYFCPNCGSTVYWRADNLPSLIGVAVGALADPKFPAPVRSIFEQSKHIWVRFDGAVEDHPVDAAAEGQCGHQAQQTGGHGGAPYPNPPRLKEVCRGTGALGLARGRLRAPMATLQFTRNYSDRSNDTGYQFEFHCDK